MNLEIRDARIDDVEIVAWTVLTALDMEIHDLDKFIKSCSANDTLYSWRNAVVATIDEQAVGCLIGYEGSRYRELRERTWPQLWDDMDPEYLMSVEAETAPGEFYLDSMAIQPGHRGLSIGKKLMTYAIEKGKALGCKNATLLVDTHKPRLEAYYRSLGFEVFAQMEYFGHIYNRMGLPNTEC